MISGDSKRKYKKNNLDAMLERHEKELQLLEELLKESKEERQITTKEERSSHMLSSEDVFTTFVKVEVNCSLRFNYENADIENVDEHETNSRNRG